MSIKLMIDSASDINKQEAEKMGVLFMPIEVRFGEEEFLDGINLTPNEFFKKLEKTFKNRLTIFVIYCIMYEHCAYGV